MKAVIALFALLLLLVLWQSAEAQTEQLCSETDRDIDDDGLIDVCDLEGLDAIRYQLDGSGYRESASTMADTTGCATGGCNGYELMKDLDFNDDASYQDTTNKALWTTGEGWQPIGSEETGFSGMFKGNGYVIRNMMINRTDSDYIGLFGNIEKQAQIDNIRLVDVELRGKNWVGSLAGNSEGEIVNSRVEGGSIEGDNIIGGLVGGNDGGIVKGSSATSSVIGRDYVGGLVGLQEVSFNLKIFTLAQLATPQLISEQDIMKAVSNPEIANSSVAGNVIGTGRFIGGLAGFNLGGDIKNSHVRGHVKGERDGVGGLVGVSQTQCYFLLSDSQGRRNANNLSFVFDAQTQCYLLLGSDTLSFSNYLSLAFDPLVTNSFASGSVEGDNRVGGLVGTNNGGIVRESSATSSVIGRDYVGGLVGLQDIFLDASFLIVDDIAKAASKPEVVNSRAVGNVIGGGGWVGGLVGFNSGGDIKNSHAHGRVEGKRDGVGGLVGISQDKYVSIVSAITNSFASGDVEGDDHVGGLVGYKANTTINSSRAIGSVKGDGSVGGLIGFNEGGNIINSDASGDVEGVRNIGGLVGSKNNSQITNSHASGNVAGEEHVGGLVGAKNSSQITNSHASGDVEGGQYVGGLVGRLISGGITDSHARGDVQGGEDIGGLVGLFLGGSITNGYASGDVEGSRIVGGLVGWLVDGSITNGYASGDVQGVQNIGGLVGYKSGDVTNSHASGDVEGGEYVGGLAGYNQSGDVTNSHASGDVEGGEYVGGLVGLFSEDSITNGYASGDVEGSRIVGGLVGWLVDGSITNSYSRGRVKGSQATGGLVGHSTSDNITNSYWNTTDNPTKTSAGGTSKTSRELKLPTKSGSISTDVYYMWSAEHWDFGTSEQYPVLKNSDGFLLLGQRIGLSHLHLLGDLLLSQAFDSNVFSYRIVNDARLTQIQLIPTAANANAEIFVSNTKDFREHVASGTTSSAILLNSNGATRIIIEVLAKNGETVEYTLDINNMTFNEGERIMLDGSSNSMTDKSSLDFSWRQVSGSSLLAGTVNQAVLNIEIPKDFVGRTTTSSKVTLRLEIRKAGVVVTSKDLTLTIVKIDNGVARLTSPITLQDMTLAAPEVDLSDDPDGVGSLDMNSYQWQRRDAGSGRWVGIGNAARYAIPEDAPLYSEYRVRFSYTDGQGYTQFFESELFVYIPDIDRDDDGLIEIYDLEGLNAIRYQLDGTGYRVSDATSKTTVGCPDDGCKGYELTRNLDFDRDGSYRYASLNKDIWTAGFGWQPIGTFIAPFNSIFNANNHTISNLRINRRNTDGVGLFGVAEDKAEIHNIGLLNVDIVGAEGVGSLVGDKKGGVIANSYVGGRIEGKDLYDVGGLVGWNQRGVIISSHSSSTVVGYRDGHNAGGLVGANDDGTVIDSYANGNVTGNENTGGLIGKNSNGGVINRSYATANVDGSAAVGGLVGESSDTIMNSYASGDVIGGADVGGLVGWNSGDITNSYALSDVKGNNEVGGLIGNNLRGAITNSYARGDVVGANEYIGGLVGWNGAGTITNSYARGNVSGEKYLGGLVGVNFREFNNVTTGIIDKSYAVGSVVGDEHSGGLVGENRQQGATTSSYWDKENSLVKTSAGGTSKTTVQLQSPIGPGSTSTEVYYDWSTKDWDFTEPSYYPLLKYATGPNKAQPACAASDDLPNCGTLILGQLQTTQLTQLVLRGALLSPQFNPAVHGYRVTAAADATHIELQLSTNDVNASIRISNNIGYVELIENSIVSRSIALNMNDRTEITIALLTENKAIEYTLHVNRLPAVVSEGLDASITVKEGREQTINVAVSDADRNDSLTLLLTAVDPSQDFVALRTTSVAVMTNDNVVRTQQMLKIKALKAGTTMLRLAVGDSDAMSEAVLLTIMVEPNSMPTITNFPSDIRLLTEVNESFNIVLNDADDDDVGNLKASVASSDDAIATASIAEAGGATRMLSIKTGTSTGTATITVLVDDQRGVASSKITQAFVVLVYSDLPTERDNTRPRIDSSPETLVIVKAGREQTIDVTVSDADIDDLLTLSLTEVFNPGLVQLITTSTKVLTNNAVVREQQTLKIKGLKSGMATLGLAVSDQNTRSQVVSVKVKIISNTTPTITNFPADISLLTGVDRNFNIVLNDADDDDVGNLKASVASSDDAIATASIAEAGGATRMLSIKTGTSTGTATIIVSVDDQRGVASSVITEMFTVAVEANTSPMITINSPPSQTIQLGSTTAIVIRVSDDNFDAGDKVAITVSTSSIVSIDPLGVIEINTDASEAFILTGDKAGTATIRFTAADSKDLSISESILVYVNTPPIVVQDIPLQMATIGKPFRLETDKFFYDADDDSLTTTARGLPNSMSVTTTGTLVGIPQVGEESKNGEERIITVSVDDGRGGSTQTSFVLLIDAPTTGTVSIASSIAWRLDATSEIGDANGISRLSYQWYQQVLRATEAMKIIGATSSTYLIADDRASRAAGTVYVVSVKILDRINQLATLSTQHVVINEAPVIGDIASLLTAEVAEGAVIDINGAISDANHDDLTYKWQVVDESTGEEIDVLAANAPLIVPTELVKPPAVQTTLTITLRLSDGIESVSRVASVIVMRMNNGVAATGTIIKEGNILKPPSIALDDPDGMPASASYQWQRCLSDCSPSSENWVNTPNSSPSLTATDYALQDADDGYRFRLKVSYTDGQGYDETIFYTSTGLIRVKSAVLIRAKVFLEGSLP